MSTAKSMTTTSYAILGLLAIKPWTTYELITQVDRSLRRIWPRAQSKLYEEPKKLVALGYARALEETDGRRRRTRCTITPAGRRALAAWLRQPGAGPQLEFEQLVKIHFADSGTKHDILANLAATLEWAHEQNIEHLATARAHLAGQSNFPQRAALNQLGGRFLTDFYTTVAEWARWAISVVETWPDDPTDAEPDPAIMQEIVRRAEALARRTGPDTDLAPQQRARKQS
jgi:DNA-binding PadR family transcriptional regulator